MKPNPKFATIRAKAFTGEKLRENKCMVIGEQVLVWDSVANSYTRCHALTKSAQRRAIALAA